jgi:uncharacterized repeat protein (TIGR01451 family)
MDSGSVGDMQDSGPEESPLDGGHPGNSRDAGMTGNPHDAGMTGNSHDAGMTGNQQDAGTTGNPDDAGTTGNTNDAGMSGNHPDAGTGTGGPARVEMVMTANPSPVVAGHWITYIIKVSNTGGEPISDVVVTDTVPNNTSFSGNAAIGGPVSFSFDGAPGNVMTWPTLTLAAGETQTLSISSQIAVGVAAGTSIQNTANVTYPGGSLSREVDVVTSASAGLTVAIAPDHSPVKPGDLVTYTTTVGNAASQSLPASNAGVLNATIPAGTTFVSASSGGTSSSGTVQWNLDSIAPGEGSQVTWTVAVDASASAGTVLQAQAQLLDGTNSLALATDATEVAQAFPLALSMTATPDPVAPGDWISYVMKVRNVGASTLTNVTVADAIPENTTVSGNSAINGPVSFSFSGSVGNVMTWPSLTLAAGETRTLSFSAQVAAGSSVNGWLVRHYAVATLPGAGSTTRTVDVVVNGTQGLSLDVVPDHAPIEPGDQVTYTLTLGNAASQALPLSNAGVLAAVVPSGTTFVSATAGGVASDGIVRWNLGSVSPGTGAHVTFTVAVSGTAQAGDVLESQAQFLDGTNSLTRSAVVTELATAFPLTLAMTANPDPIAPGDWVMYVLQVSNVGTTALTNVTVADAVPDGTTVSGNSVINGPVSFSFSGSVGNVMTWPALSLAAGETQTLSFSAQVMSGSSMNGRIIHHVAAATLPGGGSTTSARDVVVNGVAGLTLGIEPDHSPVKPGDQLTFAVTVGNTASQALPVSAHGLLVATLPAGTSFLSASSGGTVANGTVQWNLGTVAAHGGQRVTFTVAVGATASPGTTLLAESRLLDGALNLTEGAAVAEVASAFPLSLTMTANPSPAAPGQWVHYELMVSNVGSSTLTNVVVAEGVPDDTSVSGNSTIGGPVTFSFSGSPGNVMTWPTLTLAAGETQTLSFAAQVDSFAANGLVIRHAAFASLPEKGSALQAVDVLVNGVAGWNVGIEADHSPVKPGDQITYTVTVGNRASTALPIGSGGVLTTTIPAGTTFGSASSGGTQSGNTVQWSFGTIAAGASRQFTFSVTVGGSVGAGTTLESQAQLTSGTSSLALATVDTETVAAAPLKLTMTATPASVAPSAFVTYTMKVTNTGTSTLTNVVLMDPVPDGTSVSGSSAVGGPVTFSFSGAPGNVITWPSLTLTAGQTQTMSIQAQVLGGTPSGTLIHHSAIVESPAGASAQAAVDVVVN